MLFFENYAASYTIPLIINAISRKTVPMFHYCSECLDEKPCNHPCCKLWLINKCHQCSVNIHSLQGVTPPIPDSGLMLLAEVASKKLQDGQEGNATKLSNNVHKYTAKANHRKGNKVEPYKLKRCSKEELAKDIRYNM